MSDVVGAAAITVTPDFSQFKSQLAAALGPAMKDGAGIVNAAVSTMTADIAHLPKAAAASGADAGKALAAGIVTGADLVNDAVTQMVLPFDAIPEAAAHAADGAISALAAVEEGGSGVVNVASTMAMAYDVFAESAVSAAGAATNAMVDVSGATDQVAESVSRSTLAVTEGMDEVVRSTERVVLGTDAVKKSVQGVDMDSVTKGARDFGIAAVDATGAATRGMDDFNQSAGFTVSTLQKVGIGAAAVGAATLKMTTSLVQVGVDYNTLLQKTGAAFTTLLGSREAADEMIANLIEFGRSSPFPRQVFIAATQQLLGFGIEAKKIIPLFGAMQDAVAAVGGGTPELQQFTDVFASIQADGKATVEQLYRFAVVGVDAIGMLADATGKTYEQMKADISAGLVSADDTIDILTKSLTEKFGGAAANMKNTWEGAVDRVKGAWRDMGSALVAPFIDPAGGGAAVVWANKLADILRKIQGNIAGPLTTAIKNILAPIEKLFERLDLASIFSTENVEKAFQLLKDFGPVLAAIGSAMAAFSATAIPFIGQYLPAINPIIAAIAGLIVASPELRTALLGVVQAFGPLAKTLGETFGMLANLVAGVASEILTALIPIIETLLPIVTELAHTFGIMLVLAIIALRDAFMPLLPVISDAAKQLLPALLSVLPPLVDAFKQFAPVLIDIVEIGVKGLIAGIEFLLPYLDDLVRLIGENLVPILGALGAAWAVIQIIQFVSAIAGVVSTVVALINPVTLVIAAIAALVAGAIYAYQNFEPFRETVDSIAATLRDTFLSILEKVQQFISDTLIPVALELWAVFEDVFVNNILPALQDLWTTFQEDGLPIIQFLIDAWMKFESVVLPILASAIGFLVELAGPVVSGAIGLISNLIGLIGSLVQGDWEGVAESLGGIWEAIEVGILQLIGEIPGWLGGAWEQIEDGIGNLVAQLPGWLGGLWEQIEDGIGNLLAQLPGWLGGLWEQIEDGLVNLANQIPGWLGGLWENIEDGIGSFISGIPGLLGGLWEMIEGFLFGGDGGGQEQGVSLGSMLLGWFGAAVQFVLDGIPTILQALWDFFTGIPQMLLNILSGSISFIGTFLYNAAVWVVNELPNIISGIISFFSELPGKLVESVGNLGDWLYQNVFVPAVAWLVMNWPALREQIVTFFSELPGKIIDGIGNLGQWLWDNTFVALWNFLSENLPTLLGAVVDWFEELPGDIVEGLGNLGSMIWDWLVSAFNWVVENLPGLVTGLLDWFGGLGEMIFNAIGEGLSAAGGFVADLGKSLFNAIAGFLNEKLIIPIRTFKVTFGPQEFTPFEFLPEIPQLAMGGIINKATLALIGEAGREAVVPLDRPAQAARVAAEAGIPQILNDQGMGGGGTIIQLGVEVTVEATPETTEEHATMVGEAAGNAALDAATKKLKVLAAIRQS